MGRKSNREERRAQIASAMITVMARDGFEKASTASVAREAGLTTGLLHYHFNTKQEMLLAAVDALAHRFAQRRAATSPSSATQALQVFVDALLKPGRQASAEEVAAWVVVGAEALRQPEVRQAYAAVMQGLSDDIVELLQAAVVDNGGKRPPKSKCKAAAAEVLSMATGAFQLSLTTTALPKAWAAKATHQRLQAFIDAHSGGGA